MAKCWASLGKVNAGAYLEEKRPGGLPPKHLQKQTNRNAVLHSSVILN